MQQARASLLVGGAASTYLFHRPPFNAKIFQRLASGALQGAVLTIASAGIGAAAAIYARTSAGTKSKKKQKALYAFLTTYALCGGALIPVAAGTLTNRLGTPAEAFTNFALSSVLGFLAFRISLQ